MFDYAAMAKDGGIKSLEPRYALLIGNNSYAELEQLDNSVNDAILLANKLNQLDFVVTVKTEINSIEAKATLAQFEKTIKPGSAVFFYFSGHGVQIDGHNYLIMTDFKMPNSSNRAAIKSSIEKYSISLDEVVDIFHKKNVKTNIIILDACRKSPSKELEADGLAALDAPVNSLIAFATSPGKVSHSLTKEDKNSLYTKYLILNVDEPNVPVDQMLKKVHKSVYDFSKKVSYEELKNDSLTQMPWINSSLIDDFYMKISGPVSLVGNEAGDTAMWYSIKNSSDINKFLEYINKYPNGMYLLSAKKKIAELSKTTLAHIENKKVQKYVFPYGKKDTKQILNSADFFSILDNYLSESTNPIEEIKAGIEAKNTLAKAWYCALATHDRYRLGVKSNDAIKICQDEGEGLVKTPIGMFLLGRAYFFGRGVEEDKKTAIALIKKSAIAGNSMAQNFYGDLLSEGYMVQKNQNEAFSWYLKSAKQGYAPAMHNVALSYADGIGVYKSESEAINWYRKAAAKGYAWSQNNLAVLLSKNGASASEVFSLIQSSVSQNNPQGKILLARLYEHGVGVAQDKSKAIELYKDVLNTATDRELKDVAKNSLDKLIDNSRSPVENNNLINNSKLPTENDGNPIRSFFESLFR